MEINIIPPYDIEEIILEKFHSTFGNLKINS